MPLTFYTANSDGRLVSGTGYIFREIEVDSIAFSIPDEVTLDIDSYIGSDVSSLIIACYWKPLIVVLDSSPSKSDIFTSVIPRQRYGRMTYGDGDFVSTSFFIETQFQIFPTAVCWVLPIIGNPPTDSSVLPATTLVDSFTTPPFVLSGGAITSFNAGLYSTRLDVELRTITSYTVAINYAISVIDTSLGTGQLVALSF